MPSSGLSGLLRPKLFPFGKLSKAKPAAHQCCIEFETEYKEGFCASHAVIRGSGGVSDTAVRGREEFFDAAGSLRLQGDRVEGFSH